MARMTDARHWLVNAATQDVQVKYARGGARRATVAVDNLGANTATLNINRMVLAPWQYETDTIALGAQNFYPLHELASPFASSGSLHNSGTLSAGSVSASNVYDADYNAGIRSLLNGYMQNRSSGLYCTSGINQWAYECWVFLTSITGAVLYQESNAGGSHLLRCNLDATGKMSFLWTNAVTTVSHTSTITVPLNTWVHLSWGWNGAGTLTYGMNTGTVTIQSVAALSTAAGFADANGTFMGIITGATGVIAAMATFGTVGLIVANTMLYRFDEMRNAWQPLPILSQTVAAGGQGFYTMGESTANALPELFVVDMHATVDAWGTMSVTMER